MTKTKIYYLCFSVLLIVATALVISGSVLPVSRGDGCSDCPRNPINWGLLEFLSIFVFLNWFDYFLKYKSTTVKSNDWKTATIVFTIFDLIATSGICLLVFVSNYPFNEIGVYTIFVGFLLILITNAIASFNIVVNNFYKNES